MPTIDIDRDAAHEAAQGELGKPIYPKASLTERLMDWINDMLYRLADAGASLPGGWLTLSVLFILLAIAIVVAIIAGVAAAAGGVAAAVIAVPLVLALIAGLVYL
ncbi:MAG TPA: hypothetical protein VHJ79_00950, partial [Mycobacterium sp.]|nr:hypothetical protein [Mycobacterium sp.]